MRLSRKQKSHPNRGCLYAKKSRERFSLKETVLREETPSQPRLSLCSKIKRAVQSNGDCLASRKANPTAAVSMLKKSREQFTLKETLSRAEKPATLRLSLSSKNKKAVQSKGDCLASRKASPTAAVSMLKNQESGSV